jgi:hypothetical protein
MQKNQCAPAGRSFFITFTRKGPPGYSSAAAVLKEAPLLHFFEKSEIFFGMGRKRTKIHLGAADLLEVRRRAGRG